MNKYVDGKKNQKYYPHFVSEVSKQLSELGYQLDTVHFSSLLGHSLNNKNNYYFTESSLDDIDIKKGANRIESEYHFTLKQAWFPDILQTFKSQNMRKIQAPESDMNDLKLLVKKFLFLEQHINQNQYDLIFSDVSPEAEMEFGRTIGQRNGIPVIKSYEGSFLGRTILLQHFKFGKDRLIQATLNSTQFSIEDSDKFIKDFTINERPPYDWPKRYCEPVSLPAKIKEMITREGYLFPFYFVRRKIMKMLYFVESKMLKPLLYDDYSSQKPYLFFGFHLNTESTMALRSMPYTNQVTLVEMISRVLPYGYDLLVREHPHWPETFPISYLRKLKKFPNVKLISPNVSIHDLIKKSDGVLVYNSSTGIEALMHGKPVLSFAPNVYYKHHPAVHHCRDLYELGEHLAKLINTTVSKEDTISYIKMMMDVSIPMYLGSDFFFSDDDAESKAKIFAEYFVNSIKWVENN